MCARSSTAELSSYTRPVLGSNPSARTKTRRSDFLETIFWATQSAAEFRISLCEMRCQEFCLIIFILFGSIIMRVITLYTTILPKLYLYDKWKNNQRKH